MNKEITVKIFEKPYMWMSGDLIEKYSHDQFLDWAKGQVAVDIFKGELDRCINSIVMAAMARGKLAYHEQILEHNKKKKK